MARDVSHTNACVCAYTHRPSKRLQTIVLDEADKLLEMGFIEQVDAVLATAVQSEATIAFFSATMPPVSVILYPLLYLCVTCTLYPIFSNLVRVV